MLSIFNMSNYFHFHKPDSNLNLKLDSMRCIAIKNNGERCKRRVVIGLPCCHSHIVTEYNVIIRQSLIPGAGKGLFVDSGEPNNDIVFRAGDKICPYNGEIINQQQLFHRYGGYTAPYGIQINNGTYEDGARHRGVGSIVNHKPIAQSNVRFSITRDKKAYIVATKNIRNKSELYVSYGRGYRFNEEGVSTATNKQKYNI